MRKKDFWKGFLAGVVILSILSGIWRGVEAANLIPWHLLPFTKEMTAEEKSGLMMEYLERYFVGDLEDDELRESIYKAMVDGAGDRYTYYLTAEELESYVESTNGAFDGVGVYITMDEEGRVIVISPMENSPAEECGILPGDEILSIDGTEVAGLSLNEIATMVKGESGSTVTMELYREETGETFTAKMQRQKIEQLSVAYEMLEDGIGYIQLTAFKENTYDQFMEALEALQEEGLQALVLDLRNNGGGLVDSACAIGDELLPEGTMVYTIDKAGNREDKTCDAEYLDVPLVLLVNEGTASASEILSGAVQDLGVGTLVGTQTFGKGLVQGLFPLSDGSAMSITIEKYYTPNGVCIHGEGITPDVTVELPEGQSAATVSLSEDTQLQKGIEILKEELKK